MTSKAIPAILCDDWARWVLAKGLVIAGAGVLVVVAASRSEPNTGTGLDGALVTAGVGMITYGFYTFAMTRYTKMYVERHGVEPQRRAK